MTSVGNINIVRFIAIVELLRSFDIFKGEIEREEYIYLLLIQSLTLCLRVIVTTTFVSFVLDDVRFHRSRHSRGYYMYNNTHSIKNVIPCSCRCKSSTTPYCAIRRVRMSSQMVIADKFLLQNEQKLSTSRHLFNPFATGIHNRMTQDFNLLKTSLCRQQR